MVSPQSIGAILRQAQEPKHLVLSESQILADTESSDLKTLDSDTQRYGDFVRLGTASDYLMEQL